MVTVDLTFVTEYVSPIVLVICLAVGYILKNIVPSEKVNRFIPLISGILGILVSFWANWEITPETLAQGLISGLAATGLYEVFKGLLYGKE